MAARRKKKKEEVQEVQEVEQAEEVEEIDQVDQAEEPEITIEPVKTEPVKIFRGYKVAPGKGVTTRSGMVTGKSQRILQIKDFGYGSDSVEKLIELGALIEVYEDVK